MSRIGKMPVVIPKGVEVNRDGNLLKVKGPKGELSNRIPPGLTVAIRRSHQLRLVMCRNCR